MNIQGEIPAWAQSPPDAANPKLLSSYQKAVKADTTPLSVNAENGTAEFIGRHGHYIASLSDCPCGSYPKPCKHMYRLAMELGFMSASVDSNYAKMANHLGSVEELLYVTPGILYMAEAGLFKLKHDPLRVLSLFNMRYIKARFGVTDIPDGLSREKAIEFLAAQNPDSAREVTDSMGYVYPLICVHIMWSFIGILWSVNPSRQSRVCRLRKITPIY